MLRSCSLRLLRSAPNSSSGSNSSPSVITIVKRLQHLQLQKQHDEHRDDEHSEYTKTPQYPAIEEVTREAKQQRKRNSWYEHIQDLDTVEEKLLAINMPRYYGYKCFMLSDDRFPYDCLPFVQHSTRTAIASQADLPAAIYEPLRTRAEQFVQTVRDDVQAAIVFESNGYRPDPAKPETTAAELSRARSSRIVAQIHRVLTNALSSDVPHLRDVETDSDVRHEAFWFVGGIQPPARIRSIRKSCKFQKDEADKPVNRQLQYVGRPMLTVRHAHPLRPLQEEGVNAAATIGTNDTSDVPYYSHDPSSIGYVHAHRHATTVPGFWPGAQHEFGTLAYLSRGHLNERNPTYGAEDDQCALRAQAILASYGWLLGQACYQGFSIFNDPTYPLSTQTIITDGQHWSFYAYQLNTTQTHQDAIDSNAKVNRCWATAEAQLYERVQTDGTIIGWNDAVLCNLIQFYLNEPARREHAMRPYLGVHEQRNSQILDGERREFVESRYKHLVSNRPRHRLVPEIYHWEKFYKIDNKTLQLAPKRRFFELYQNPFQRRLDEHTPVYVPKVVRPGGPKSKVDRWENTFYPGGKKK